jgi:hypothetical protein
MRINVKRLPTGVVALRLPPLAPWALAEGVELDVLKRPREMW